MLTRKEGPTGEPARLDKSDEKTTRTWLLYTEARRAEARRVRMPEKECVRELQALLHLKLGEEPDAMDCTGGGAKVKPGKTVIMSMPQLVAHIIMKQHDTPRLFSPRKHNAPYIFSPLSRFELTVGEVWHSWNNHWRLNISARISELMLDLLTISLVPNVLLPSP